MNVCSAEHKTQQLNVIEAENAVGTSRESYNSHQMKGTIWAPLKIATEACAAFATYLRNKHSILNIYKFKSGPLYVCMYIREHIYNTDFSAYACKSFQTPIILANSLT